MAKFHNTPDGPRPCTASVRACPVGDESDHYPNEQEARKAYESSMNQQYGTLAIHSRAKEVESVEAKASRALAERETLGRAEAILASDSSQEAVHRAWAEVENLESVEEYKEDFDSRTGSAEELQDIADLARSDVEMKLQEYSDQMDGLEEDTSPKLEALDPMDWSSGPSQKFARNHGWHPYDDQWENFETESGDKLHVVRNDREAPGEVRFFVAKRKPEFTEFGSQYSTPKEISPFMAGELGYSKD